MSLIGFWRWSDNTRFYVQMGKDGVAHKIDRKTGDIWTLHGAEATVVAELKEAPPDVVSKIDGKAAYQYERQIVGSRKSSSGLGNDLIEENVMGPYLKGKLYNGSDWEIVEIEVFITNQRGGKDLPEGTNEWEREFREKIRLKPKSHCDFDVSTIDGQTHHAHQWTILRAWGYER